MSDACELKGTIEGIYDAEEVIKNLIKPLFPEGNVFTQYTMDDLDKEFFKDMPVEKRLAALIVYSGFAVKGNAGRNVQKIAPLWRVIVVTPSELYKSVAGVKLIEVIKAVKGKTIYPDSGKELLLETDVREFNVPDFVNSLVGIPAVFSFDMTI